MREKLTTLSSLMSVTNHSILLKECCHKEHPGAPKLWDPPPPNTTRVNSVWPTNDLI